jgi:hypothetical protein
MATKRDYLVGLGLAKPGRGRFSKEATEALAAAEAAGQIFDEPVKPVKEVATEGDKPSQPSKPTSESSLIRSWAADNGIKVGERGRIPSDVIKAYGKQDATGLAETPKVYTVTKPSVRTRQTATMYGEDDRGTKIGFSMCRRCAKHISWCSCSTGPKPPSMVVNILDQTDPL